jgi:hypothetical protein
LSDAGDTSLTVAVFASLLSAMFDCAAIAIDAGGNAQLLRSTINGVIERLIN